MEKRPSCTVFCSKCGVLMTAWSFLWQKMTELSGWSQSTGRLRCRCAWFALLGEVPAPLPFNVKGYSLEMIHKFTQSKSNLIQLAMRTDWAKHPYQPIKSHQIAGFHSMTRKKCGIYAPRCQALRQTCYNLSGETISHRRHWLPKWDGAHDVGTTARG